PTPEQKRSDLHWLPKPFAERLRRCPCFRCLPRSVARSDEQCESQWQLELEFPLVPRSAVWQRSQHSQPAPEMAHCLAQLTVREGPFARSPPRCDGGLRLPGLRVVVGEHLGLLLGDS